MLDAKAHAAYLRTYAAHADHAYAPEVCRWARAEIERTAPEPETAPAPERELVTRDLFGARA